MDAKESVLGNLAAIHLKGRFAFPVHRMFRAVVKRPLADSSIREIKINLDGVEYIDSSALGLLLELRESARVTGKTVSLTGAYGIVRQTLNTANFDKLFPLNER